MDMSQSLPATIDAAAAHDLKAKLEESLLAGSDLALDGAGVERVGTQAIQVLLAAAGSFAAEGRAFSLAHPSATLSQAFEDLGLASTLKSWRTD